VNLDASDREGYLALAIECEERSNPDDVFDRFKEAMVLIIRSRGLATDPDLNRFVNRFDRLLMTEAYESAAMMIAPCDNLSGPGWFGGQGSYFPLTMTTHGYRDGVYKGPMCTIHHPISSGGGPFVESIAPLPSLAMLGAILRAHSKWPEIWAGLR
jgi:hypothetical protein